MAARTGGERAEAMARRLDRTARRLGLAAADRTLLIDAFRVVMAPRMARLADDHDPDYLHPARTALILTDDCRIADVATLVAALLAETRVPDVAVPAASARRLDPAAAAIVAAVPAPDVEGDRLLESLLAASPETRFVACAERLDHARHLHLRPRDEWEPYHGITCAAYAPVAGRTHPRLGQRLDWWCSIFRGRFLKA